MNDNSVRDVYNNIAEGWYHLRQWPITPELDILAKKWTAGTLLDIGCGIGNSLLPFAMRGFVCTGLDISEEMLKQAKRYCDKHNISSKLIQGDATAIPFADASFDYVISIAVFHHLDSEEKRLKALAEIKRVLKPDGLFFLTVWNRERKGDDYIIWNRKGTKYERYYHFFSISELKELLKKANITAKVYEDDRKKNICMEGRK